jgi:hypothetical protein
MEERNNKKISFFSFVTVIAFIINIVKWVCEHIDNIIPLIGEGICFERIFLVTAITIIILVLIYGFYQLFLVIYKKFVEFS